MQYCESDFLLYIVYVAAYFQLIIIQYEQISSYFMNGWHHILLPFWKPVSHFIDIHMLHSWGSKIMWFSPISFFSKTKPPRNLNSCLLSVQLIDILCTYFFFSTIPHLFRKKPRIIETFPHNLSLRTKPRKKRKRRDLLWQARIPTS